jgi:tetratricopeptide (TPR) repeat protein
LRSVLGVAFASRQSLCRQAIGSSPQQVRSRRHRLLVQNRNDPRRVAAYSGLGQYRAGLADCNQAIAFDPKDENEYFNRGVIYEYLRENAEAIADYQKTLAINLRTQMPRMN